MIRYDNLWVTMKKRKITTYKLIKDYDFSSSLLARMKRNENVTTHTIDRLCKALNCNVDDIMVFKNSEEDD